MNDCIFSSRWVFDLKPSLVTMRISGTDPAQNYATNIIRRGVVQIIKESSTMRKVRPLYKCNTNSPSVHNVFTLSFKTNHTLSKDSSWLRTTQVVIKSSQLHDLIMSWTGMLSGSYVEVIRCVVKNQAHQVSCKPLIVRAFVITYADSREWQIYLGKK